MLVSVKLGHDNYIPEWLPNVYKVVEKYICGKLVFSDINKVCDFCDAQLPPWRLSFNCIKCNTCFDRCCGVGRLCHICDNGIPEFLRMRDSVGNVIPNASYRRPDIIIEVLRSTKPYVYEDIYDLAKINDIINKMFVRNYYDDNMCVRSKAFMPVIIISIKSSSIRIDLSNAFL